MRNNISSRLKTAEAATRKKGYKYAFFSIIKNGVYVVDVYVPDGFEHLRDAILRGEHLTEYYTKAFSDLTEATDFILNFTRAGYLHNAIALPNSKAFTAAEIESLKESVPRCLILTEKQFEFTFNITLRQGE